MSLRHLQCLFLCIQLLTRSFLKKSKFTKGSDVKRKKLMDQIVSWWGGGFGKNFRETRKKNSHATHQNHSSHHPLHHLPPL
jgi:hypothetical protein